MKTILHTIFILSLSAHLAAQTTHEITWMMGITNEEASITIEEGDTILWIWGEPDMPHDVSSVDPNAPDGFGSEIMKGLDSSYEFTFEEAVVFDYRCSVHPQQMVGTITVEPALSLADKFRLNLKHYPNPVLDEVVITSLLPLNKFEVFSLHGTRVLAGTIESLNVLNINLESLAPGMYFIKVFSENQSGVIKLIKQ